MTKIPAIKERILRILSNSDKEFSKRRLSQKLKLSPATIGKYVEILNAEGRVNIKKYGNLHLITLVKKNDS